MYLNIFNKFVNFSEYIQIFKQLSYILKKNQFRKKFTVTTVKMQVQSRDEFLGVIWNMQG